MRRRRRRPNAVASQATEGAMKICEPIAAVESQAPSSKPNENAPRRSGNPTDVSRLSKFARNEPSSTAATANKGCGATPPRESGPWSARSASLLWAIGCRLVGVNSGFHRHPRQQTFQQGLAFVEQDPDRDALNHLGEIAGGVVGWQQRALRSARGRNPLHASVQSFVREAVHGDLHGLPRLDPGELRLLVVGNHVDIRQRHDIDEAGADIDVVARLHLPLAGDAVEWRHDPGIAEPELGRGERRLGALEVGRALLLGARQYFELMALRGDDGLAGANVGLRARVIRDGLFKFLARAGFRLG